VTEYVGNMNMGQYYS